jgi:hypothetical protein
MRLGSVGRVEESNSLDLDSHADCCVCGKEVLIFNDFGREVTVTGWDPEGAAKALRIMSAARLQYSGDREDGAFDCPSEHVQPHLEPQLVEHHENEIA